MTLIQYRDAAGNFQYLPLIGPTGPTGPQGEGTQGPMGPTGPQGPVGPTSTVAGAQGVAGDRGDTGNTGASVAGGKGAGGQPQGITFRRGEAYISPTANKTSSVTISYSGFTQLPTVFASARTTVPGTVQDAGCNTGPGLTSAVVNCYRINSTGTYVQWIAIGVGSPSS